MSSSTCSLEPVEVVEAQYQSLLLYVNAWRRFARFDGMVRDADPRAVMLIGAGILGMPGALVAVNAAVPLVLGRATHPMFINPQPSLNLLAVLSGLLVALATLLHWDSLLPSPADAALFAGLPVTSRRVVTAQGAALLTLLGLLIAAVNGPALVLIPLLDTQPPIHLAAILMMTIRQAVAVGITAILAFSVVLGLHALVDVSTNRRKQRIVGQLVQFLGLALVFSGLLLVPGASGLRPQWRFGLPSVLPLAPAAAAAFLAATGLYILAARRALQPAPSVHIRRRKALPRWEAGLPPALGAVTRFAVLSLARCSRQRFVVFAWLACGAAFLLQLAISSAAAAGHGGFAVHSAKLALGTPVLLAVFCLLGLRHSFEMPVELRANWVFRLGVEEPTRDLAASGRWIMGMSVILWLGIATTLSLCFFGLGTAWRLDALMLGIGAVCIQLLTTNLRKIPFTCSYRPGGMSTIFLWPFCAIAVGCAAFALAIGTAWLLASAARVGCVAAVVLVILLYTERARRATAGGEFVYEADPDVAVQTIFGG